MKCPDCPLKHLPICAGETLPNLCSPVPSGHLCQKSKYFSSLAGYPAMKPWTPEPLVLENSILITGGIGDFLALECYFTPEYRKGLERVYYATKQWKSIRDLFGALPNYGDLSHLCLWEDWSQRSAFYSLEELAQRLGLPQLLAKVQDWSIVPTFPQIDAGRLSYVGSSFLEHTVADISGIALPRSYVVVCPYSENKEDNRDFKANDWIAVLNQVRKAGSVAVVLNKGNDRVPRSKYLVDLSNKTTLLESIEILKGARGYYGIDSCLSVLAAKLFDGGSLLVKSTNPHLAMWKHIYYAPKREFDFVKQTLGKPVRKKCCGQH